MDELINEIKELKIRFNEIELKLKNIIEQKEKNKIVEKKELIEKKDDRRILVWTYVDGSPRFYRVVKETKCKIHVVRITEKYTKIDGISICLPGRKDSNQFNWFTKTSEGIKYEGKLVVEWSEELKQNFIKEQKRFHIFDKV